MKLKLHRIGLAPGRGLPVIAPEKGVANQGRNVTVKRMNTSAFVNDYQFENFNSLPQMIYREKHTGHTSIDSHCSLS